MKSDTWKGIEYQKYFLFYKMFKKMESKEEFTWGFDIDPNNVEADFIVGNEFFESKSGVLEVNSVINTDNQIPVIFKKALQQLHDELRTTSKSPFIITNHEIKHANISMPAGSTLPLKNLYKIEDDIEYNGKKIPLAFIEKVNVITYPVNNASSVIELDKLLRKEIDFEFLDNTYGIDSDIFRTIKEKFISLIINKTNGYSNEVELLSYYCAILGNPNHEKYDDSTIEETKELIKLIKETQYMGDDLETIKNNPANAKYIRLIKQYEEKYKLNEKHEKLLRRTDD